ncbi:MAG TPA: iron-sulfur cluster biosynthesis family protein [Bacillota bacterium]|mgnify:CR=1 FL=1|jgi:uncharacterized protein YqkB|nr:iron-sulfur cluster biosynthesis family protein [Bacillota bacterium]
MKGKEGIQIQLEITEKALQKIKTISEKPVLLLWYDTDECGCGVNGLPTIRLAREIKESYMEVECSEMNVFVEKQQKVFFAECMKLDWTGQVFRLASPEQIMNPFIPASQIFTL